MPQMAMVHDIDPAQVIKDKVGDLSGVRIAYSNVLIGIYMRPEKTKGGLYVPDQYRDEDIYQGKAGLVLKLGDLAFRDADDVSFNGFLVKPGDWIVIRPSDGWPVSINGQHCRIVSDAGVKMVVDSPDLVW
jgi:co-chaperonin GroES (HSP10)